MHDTPRPHDLLWGMRPEQLPADAPAWAVAVLAAGQPVVVRRAVVAPGQVAVGLRGATRDQRLAALMPIAAIRHRLAPEQLLDRRASEDLPVFRVLAGLRPLLDALGYAWGVTGSAGFQLATGLSAAHPDSDLTCCSGPNGRCGAARRARCCSCSKAAPAASTCNWKLRWAVWRSANGPVAPHGCWSRPPKDRVW